MEFVFVHRSTRRFTSIMTPDCNPRHPLPSEFYELDLPSRQSWKGQPRATSMVGSPTVAELARSFFGSWSEHPSLFGMANESVLR